MTNNISSRRGGAGQLVSRLILSGGVATQLAIAPQATASIHLIPAVQGSRSRIDALCCQVGSARVVRLKLAAEGHLTRQMETPRLTTFRTVRAFFAACTWREGWRRPDLDQIVCLYKPKSPGELGHTMVVATVLVPFQ